MKINYFAVSAFALLSALMLYSAISPEAYFFGRWIPSKTLKLIGVPITTIRLLIMNSDIIAHLIGAYLITMLSLFSFKPWFKSSTINQLKLALLLTLLFTVVELFQLIIGRTFSLQDITAGVLGALLSMLCFSFVSRAKAIS